MYKITVLVENCVYSHHLRGEHGLSLLIETAEHKILFDTGSSNLFAHNARLLGYDLSEVDYLVLSHGHSDHTGGVKHFLKLNSKAKIVCKREILDPKFKGERENGFKYASKISSDRFVFVDSDTELLPGIFILSSIPITNPNDTHFDKFDVLREGTLKPDTFEDELALVLSDQMSYSLVSACSHRGITNILEAAEQQFKSQTLSLLLGGFHIHTASQDKFSTIADHLEHTQPQSLGVCHCTGVEKFALFKQQFEQTFYAHTGKQITI